MIDDFDSQYIGRFSDDPILKALKKSFISVANKDRMLFLPQSIIKQGIESIRLGDNPEEVLCAVLDSLGKLANDLHKQAITRAQFEVSPIMVIKDEK